jgi:DNA-binding response OmpR family regulator
VGPIHSLGSDAPQLTSSDRPADASSPRAALLVVVLSAGMFLALAPLAKGEQALALAFEFDPKAVLLDIGMPGINGLEVARELRRRMGAGVRLIAVTGWGQAQDRELAPWQRTTSSER